MNYAPATLLPIVLDFALKAVFLAPRANDLQLTKLECNEKDGINLLELRLPYQGWKGGALCF